MKGHHWAARRFERYVEEDRGYTSPCWIFSGCKDQGYGVIAGHRAHRLYYEHYVGPIPTDMTIDHLCVVRACVNPAHLEVVTRSVNSSRGRHTQASAPPVMTNSEKAAIHSMVLAGLTDGQIADQLGRSRGGVRDARVRLGLRKTKGAKLILEGCAK